jgi:hypothetical protein
MARTELFIWWTSDTEVFRLVGPEAPDYLPDYVREQYRLRYAARGRGYLWVDPRFGKREIAEWPATNIARMLKEGSFGGVVFSERDFEKFTRETPGLVTDFKARILVEKK